MEHRKGIHLCKKIAAAMLERHKVAFIFAGQDPFLYMSDTLLPYINSISCKGSIHYLGKLDRMESHSCLGQSDIFLIPSLWENCPYACLEAMAAGRAIVSSNQGGLPELIQDGANGLLAQSSDPASYIAKLEQLLEDKGLRERLGVVAHETVRKIYRYPHRTAIGRFLSEGSLTHRNTPARA